MLLESWVQIETKKEQMRGTFPLSLAWNQKGIRPQRKKPPCSIPNLCKMKHWEFSDRHPSDICLRFRRWLRFFVVWYPRNKITVNLNAPTSVRFYGAWFDLAFLLWRRCPRRVVWGDNNFASWLAESQKIGGISDSGRIPQPTMLPSSSVRTLRTILSSRESERNASYQPSKSDSQNFSGRWWSENWVCWWVDCVVWSHTLRIESLASDSSPRLKQVPLYEVMKSLWWLWFYVFTAWSKRAYYSYWWP